MPVELLAHQAKTDLKSSRTACGKVWKLLFRLIWVPSTMAIFPNICKSHCQVPSTLSQALTTLQRSPELFFLLFTRLWVCPKETETRVWVLWGSLDIPAYAENAPVCAAHHLGQRDKVL